MGKAMLRKYLRIERKVKLIREIIEINVENEIPKSGRKGRTTRKENCPILRKGRTKEIIPTEMKTSVLECVSFYEEGSEEL